MLWLKDHNPLYTDITISEERLSALPTDGIPEELSLVAKYSPDVTTLAKEHEGYVPEQSEDEIDNNITGETALPYSQYIFLQ